MEKTLKNIIANIEVEIATANVLADTKETQGKSTVFERGMAAGLENAKKIVMECSGSEGGERMRNGIIAPEDGNTLLEIYKVFDINGVQRRPLTMEEQVLIFSIGKGIQEGKIVSGIGGDE